MQIPTLALPTHRERLRINSNPKLSLEVYRRMKADDFHGHGVSVQELASRLAWLSTSGTTKSYLSNR